MNSKKEELNLALKQIVEGYEKVLEGLEIQRGEHVRNEDLSKMLEVGKEIKEISKIVRNLKKLIRKKGE